jgi:hypothetical protein
LSSSAIEFRIALALGIPAALAGAPSLSGASQAEAEDLRVCGTYSPVAV